MLFFPPPPPPHHQQVLYPPRPWVCPENLQQRTKPLLPPWNWSPPHSGQADCTLGWNWDLLDPGTWQPQATLQWD